MATISVFFCTVLKTFSARNYLFLFKIVATIFLKCNLTCWTSEERHIHIHAKFLLAADSHYFVGNDQCFSMHEWLTLAQSSLLFVQKWKFYHVVDVNCIYFPHTINHSFTKSKHLKKAV